MNLTSAPFWLLMRTRSIGALNALVRNSSSRTQAKMIASSIPIHAATRKAIYGGSRLSIPGRTSLPAPPRGTGDVGLDRLSVSLSILVFGSATALACLHTANHQQLTTSRVAGWAAIAAYNSRVAF